MLSPFPAYASRRAPRMASCSSMPVWDRQLAGGRIQRPHFDRASCCAPRKHDGTEMGEVSDGLRDRFAERRSEHGHLAAIEKRIGSQIGRAASLAQRRKRQNRTCGPRIQLFGSICHSGNSNCPDACTLVLSSSRRFPRILRRHHPQQEHPDGLLPGGH
jgi:hypothetical protein